MTASKPDYDRESENEENQKPPLLSLKLFLTLDSGKWKPWSLLYSLTTTPDSLDSANLMVTKRALAKIKYVTKQIKD